MIDTELDFSGLPDSGQEFMNWTWMQIQPFFDVLESITLTSENLHDWMMKWSQLMSLVVEANARFLVGTTSDTANEELEAQFNTFLKDVFSRCKQADIDLKIKLVESGLEPENFAEPLKRIKVEIEIFSEKNLPLFTQEKQLNSDFGKIMGSQTVPWNGVETTLSQLEPISFSGDRSERKKAWKLSSERRLMDRDKLNALWTKYMEIRLQQAENAGCSSYTEFIWNQKNRFDYTPADCEQFQDSIEKIVVPAAERIYEAKREGLGLENLRPWDLNADSKNREPLNPFKNGDELTNKSLAIFNNVSTTLGSDFEIMKNEGLLDLENRKGKAPGGYCTTYNASKKPFIFMNSVGLQRDVRTMLHEAGHAFHAFEKVKLPYLYQRDVGSEFNEVASMAMELLSAPFLTKEFGGFYTSNEAARARIEHLEGIIQFWPYMAVVDAFQLWVYANPEQAMKTDNCDQQWSQLWDRFMVGIDWSGFEEFKVTGWHRKLHIFQVPFYYVEYGMAQLAAVQVWANALDDQTKAVEQYRQALALGGTVSLPVLFETAGAKFAFDQGTIQNSINLLERQLESLRGAN
jgi:oligoendopeptidase F